MAGSESLRVGIGERSGVVDVASVGSGEVPFIPRPRGGYGSFSISLTGSRGARFYSVADHVANQDPALLGGESSGRIFGCVLILGFVFFGLLAFVFPYFYTPLALVFLFSLLWWRNTPKQRALRLLRSVLVDAYYAPEKAFQSILEASRIDPGNITICRHAAYIACRCERYKDAVGNLKPLRDTGALNDNDLVVIRAGQPRRSSRRRLIAMPLVCAAELGTLDRARSHRDGGWHQRNPGGGRRHRLTGGGRGPTIAVTERNTPGSSWARSVRAA